LGDGARPKPFRRAKDTVDKAPGLLHLKQVPQLTTLIPMILLLAILSPALHACGAVRYSAPRQPWWGCHRHAGFASARTCFPIGANACPRDCRLCLGGWLGWALVRGETTRLARRRERTAIHRSAALPLSWRSSARLASLDLLASRTVRTLKHGDPAEMAYFEVRCIDAQGIHVPLAFWGTACAHAASRYPAASVCTHGSGRRCRDGPSRKDAGGLWRRGVELVRGARSCVAPTAAGFSGAQIATIYPTGLTPRSSRPPARNPAAIYSSRNLATNRAGELHSIAPVMRVGPRMKAARPKEYC